MTVEQIANRVCALLNGAGGGVVRDVAVDVVPVALSLVRPSAPVLTDRQGELCTLEVPAGPDRPYSVNGAFYVADGDGVRPAENDEVRDMLMTAAVRPIRWERQFADLVSTDNFDVHELEAFAHNVAGGEACDLDHELEKCGLSCRGRYTNAADVLLSSDVAVRQPQTRVVAVSYSSKIDDEYRGCEKFQGPLLSMFLQLWKFFLDNAVGFQKFSDENPAREAVYRFPPKAVREGLINALVHRDYESYAGTVRVEIDSEKMVISNVGGLFGGGSTEAKTKEFKSGRLLAFRNPDLANYLSIRHYMEMSGRGVRVIRQECDAAGLPEPRWDISDDSVSLTIFSPTQSRYIQPKHEPGLSYVCDTMLVEFPAARNQNDGFSAPVPFWPKTWPKNWPKTWPKSWPMNNANKILSLLYFSAMSMHQLCLKIGVKPGANSVKRAVNELLARKHVELTVENVPTSRLQKYRLSDLGRQYVMGLSGNQS